MRPNPELEVDLPTAAPIGAAAIRAVVGCRLAPLSVPAIEDDLDVGVISESFEQIFVEAGVAA
jgi:hypothetical protein